MHGRSYKLLLLALSALLFAGAGVMQRALNRERASMGLTRVEVEGLFAGFVFDQFNEEEKDDKTSMGEMKHWHVFHVVARKG